MRCEMFLIAGSLCWAAAATAAGDETTLDQRREQLAQMSDAEKTSLLAKKKRFDDLPWEEQQRYRDLHAELSADPHEEQLRATLKRYSDWLKTLPPGDRAELARLPASERLQRVRELMEVQATERFRQMVSEAYASHDLLSREDREVICQWTDEFLGRHAQEILATVPDAGPFLEVKTRFDLSKHIHFLRFWFFRQAGWGPGSGGHGFMPGPPPRPGDRRWQGEPSSKGEPAGPPPGEKGADSEAQSVARRDPRRGLGVRPGAMADGEAMPSPSEQRLRLLEASSEDIEALSKQVSPQARKILSKAHDARERAQIVEGWMLAAFLGRFMPSREELDRFVRESLEPDDRRHLERFPRDRMYEELQKLYFRKRFEARRRGMMRSRSRDEFDDRDGRGPDGQSPRWGDQPGEAGPPPRRDGSRGPRGPEEGSREMPEGRRGSPDQFRERHAEPGGERW